MKTKICNYIRNGDFKAAYCEIETQYESFSFNNLSASIKSVSAIQMYCFLMYAISKKETAELHLSICNYLYFMEPRITDADSLIKWHLVRAFDVSHNPEVLNNWILGVYSGNPDCPFSNDELNYYKAFLNNDS